MSGGGAPVLRVTGAGLRVGLVAASWHAPVMAGLVAGARRALAECGVGEVVEVEVPGTFELPVAAARLAASGIDAVVALGVVVRGGTPHFDYVCRAATDGLTQVAVSSGVPVGFGVLTCDTVEQALARSGLPGSTEDKGHEAATAAVATAVALRTPSLAPVKTFDTLFAELAEKASRRPEGSGTVSALDAGVHAIGKKIVEEAAEVWMAAEHESGQRAAEEISQLLYHLQVLMLARGLTLEDVYAHL